MSPTQNKGIRNVEAILGEPILDNLLRAAYASKFKWPPEELTACKAREKARNMHESSLHQDTTGAHITVTFRVPKNKSGKPRDIMASLLDDASDDCDVGAHSHGMDDSSHVSRELAANTGAVMAANTGDVLESLLNDASDKHDVGAHIHSMDNSSHVSTEPAANTGGDLMDELLDLKIVPDESDDIEVEFV